MSIDWKEVAAVATVGAGLALLGRRVPVLKHPIVLGTAMYTAGYVAREMRPDGGWPLLDKLPDVPRLSSKD